MKRAYLSLITVTLISLLWTATSAAQTGGAGKVECEVLENGEPASGAISLRKDDNEIAQGSCNQPLSAPAGTYEAVISLDGALDGPEQKQTVTIKAGAVAKLKADFATGILQIFIESAGKQAAGMAVIRREGNQIGTLGSGVVAHLSAGTYEVIARYRTEKKSFDSVVVEPGKRLVLNASFE